MPGLLAKAGLLDGKEATSNKLSWDWVIAQSDKAQWKKHARWVADGNIITSAGGSYCSASDKLYSPDCSFEAAGTLMCSQINFVGVSAGMDMILHFIALTLGQATARQAAKFAEYNGQWTDPNEDPWGTAAVED